MAVPRNRISNARKNSRRSHHAYRALCLSKCPSCGAQRLSHRACPACGHYKGRTVVEKKQQATG